MNDNDKNTSRQRILFTGETIQNTQNIEKPLGGRGSAPNPAGEAHSAPPDLLAGGEGTGCPLLKNSIPTFGPSGLRRCGLSSNPLHSENPGFAPGSMGCRVYYYYTRTTHSL